jgi:hypothetical protein
MDRRREETDRQKEKKTQKERAAIEIAKSEAQTNVNIVNNETVLLKDSDPTHRQSLLRRKR